ncbi:histone-lysine N-methyltransferase SETD1A [Lepisosteus oculatus]|uniref:histone-lysine N-methyltransferase SETD1A n=1 Tax=Lepisosteus oculatus TaxID=7918 RepID=UPI00371C7DA1
MDPDSGADTQRALNVQWRSYKLIVDPALKKVSQKIYRYDGVHFSVPDSGFAPVGEVRDPRPRRIWSKHRELSLPVPKFKLDEYYVGPVPLKEVTFAHLNDNIREPFLAEMCAKFGEVEEMEILFHPKTRKHLGLAKVLFSSTRGAKETVKHLHNTSVMGNIVHVQLDIRGQQRMKYYDLIVSGSYTPQTVPTGGKALSERFLPPLAHPDTLTELRRRVSTDALTPGGSNTPCSVDTGFSSDQRMDTPSSSLGGPYTPGSSTSSQGGGTPYTPRSGTPYSQDSAYSNRHGGAGFSGTSLSSSYPQDHLLSSSISSSSSGFKPPRYHDDPYPAHPPPLLPQDSAYSRRPSQPYPPPLGSFLPSDAPYPPPYGNAGGPPLHPAQYDAPALPDPGRESGRYGPSAGSRRASDSRSYHHHHLDGGGASKSSSSYHSHHHSERREDRGYRSGGGGGSGSSSGHRSGEGGYHHHQRHRNHHHSHNHHGGGRRRSSRDRDGEYANSSDLRYSQGRGAGTAGSVSLTPPAAASSSSGPGKDHPLPPPAPLSSSSSSSSSSSDPSLPLSSRLEQVFRPQAPGRGGGGGAGGDRDYRVLAPPPPPPPLPPASVITAAVAESYGPPGGPPHLDGYFPAERSPPPASAEPPTDWAPAPPRSPPPAEHCPSESPAPAHHPALISSSSSPPAPPLPPPLASPSSSSSPPRRRAASPEPDSTNESLPFVYHSSSLDSRIEMLLKEQKTKFSFLASDEEEEEEGEGQEEGEEGSRPQGEGEEEEEGEKGSAEGQEAQERERERRRRERRRGGDRDAEGARGRRGEKESRRRRASGRKEGARRSPAAPSSSSSSSCSSALPPPPSDPTAALPEPLCGGQEPDETPHSTLTIPCPRTESGDSPPAHNGQGQSSPQSSGEDMEISEEEEELGPPSAPDQAPQAVPGGAPTSDPSDSAGSDAAQQQQQQHFSTVLPPPLPSFPPHMPPPPPGFGLQPPPGLPPPLSHLEYPPLPPPHHSVYDYASSMELVSQYTGGAPMSFQMQTQMLSRLHQMRLGGCQGNAGTSNGAAGSRVGGATEIRDPDFSAYPPSHGPPHLHSLPPPPPHAYMDQDGARFDQDHRYGPPPIAPLPYGYPEPPHPHSLPPPHPHSWPHCLPPQFPPYHPSQNLYGPLSPSATSSYPGFSALPPPPAQRHPHEATVDLVLAALIQEMKNIMQRDLNRKMIENIAFGTFDEWWERKERKAKPFQTVVKAPVREEEKKEKEEKASRPREAALLSLVDWAKSGGLEGFSLRGALRLPSFKVKRKEPLELSEAGDLKRPRPSTPADEDDDDSYRDKGMGLLGHADSGTGPGRDGDGARRKGRLKRRKAFDLDSEGEETSEGSSSDKEDDDDDDDSDKDSEDEAVSEGSSKVDSDDESASSSDSESSSGSSSSSSEDEEDEEEEEEEGARVEEGVSEGEDSVDTMDESTMDSSAEDREREKDSEKERLFPSSAIAAAIPDGSKVSGASAAPDVPQTGEVKTARGEEQQSEAAVPPAGQSATAASALSRREEPSPVLLLPPLKKRRKTVSFSAEEGPTPAPSPGPLLLPPLSPSPSPSLLLSPVKPQPPESILTAPAPPTVASPPSPRPDRPSPVLLPFATKPSEGGAPLPGPQPPPHASVLTVPPPVRSLRPDDQKRPAPPPPSPPAQSKSPSRRSSKDSPKSPPAAGPAPQVCRTVHNLPLDHASLVKAPSEEPAAAPASLRGRPRGRPRSVSLSAPPLPPPAAAEDEDEEEQGRGAGDGARGLRLREQLGASSLLELAHTSSPPSAPPDLSVLADVALKLEPEAPDSEETETSDEAEEQQLQQQQPEQGPPPSPYPEGLAVWLEHNYSKPLAPPPPPPLVAAAAAQKKAPRAEAPPPADINHHPITGVLEAPEEVIGEAPCAPGPARADPLDLLPPLAAVAAFEDAEGGDRTQASAAPAPAPALTPGTPPARRRGSGPPEEERGRVRSRGRKKRRKEKQEQQQKQKERQSRKQRKRRQAEEEDVDVEDLEPGEVNSDEEEEEEGGERRRERAGEELRKSERLFLQQTVTPSGPLAPPALQYEQRSEFEQMTILYDIWNSGLDVEDMRFLKMTYERLLQEDHSTDWLNDTHWVHHTITNIPNPRRKKRSQDGQLREHKTGCARSEGYYSISKKEKDVYLNIYPVTARELEYDSQGTNRVLSERRSEQRRLLSAIGTQAVMDSDLLKLNQLKFRKKKLRFGRSRIHEWGLFAMEPIAADEMVIEYVGQNIRQVVADMREKRYAQEGIGSSYLFRVDHDTIIDATKCGNLARFINHCCTPNCYAKVITLESQKKIVIYSKQPIGINEEITYDYKFPIEENKIPCLCGTENCRGTLN